MSGLKIIDVTIEGASPMLVRRFSDAQQESATSGKRGSSVGNNGTPQEQADDALYKDEKGKPIMPGVNIFQCIMAGGRFFKMGKKQVTTARGSLLPACVIMNTTYAPIVHKQPWKVDTRPVKIPATGGRILRHRPCFDDWKMSFSVQLDEEIMSAEFFREIVDAAGNRIGMGDYRLDCRGPFGRFKVVSWKVK